MTLTTDRFPSSLPNWIREWAREHRDGEQAENDDITLRLVPEDIEVLWRILSSADVALNLERLDRGKSVEDREHQSRVLGLLRATVFLYWMSNRQVTETPSRQKKKLKDLAWNVDRVAARIRESGDFLGPALNVRYLQKRFASEPSKGFVRKRMALGAPGLFPTDHSEVLITDLLDMFSDDVMEELALYSKRIDGLDGGSAAPVRYQIQELKRYYRAHFGRDNNRLIASILSAINEKDIQEERVKKTAIYLRGKNLL